MNWLDIDNMKLDQLQFLKLTDGVEYLIVFKEQSEVFVDYASSKGFDMSFVSCGYDSTFTKFAVMLKDNAITTLFNLFDDGHELLKAECKICLNEFLEHFKNESCKIIEYKFKNYV